MTVEPERTIEQEIRRAQERGTIDEQISELVSRSAELDRSSRITRRILYIMLIPAIVFIVAVIALTTVSARMMRERPFVRLQQVSQEALSAPEYCSGDTFTFDVDVSTKVVPSTTSESRSIPLPLPRDYSIWTRPRESTYIYTFNVPDLAPGSYEVRLTSREDSTVGSTIIIPFNVKECD